MKKMIFTVLLLKVMNLCNAQEVLAVAGKEAANGNTSISYTIGEPIILTLQNGTIKLTQGFQQNVYSIATLTKENNLDLSVKVFPNPVSNLLQVQLALPYNNSLQLKLFSLEGKIVWQGNIGNGIQMQNIDISSLAASTYFLHLIDEKNQLQSSYKIEKINN